MASVLVKRGTLRRGELLVAGRAWARVRAMRTDFSATAGVDALQPGEAAEVSARKPVRVRVMRTTGECSLLSGSFR